MPTIPVPPTFNCSGTDSSPINYFAAPAPTYNFIGETLNSSGAGLVIITPDSNSANTAIVRLDSASSIVTSASVNNNGILADTQGAGVSIITSGPVTSNEGRAIIGNVEQGAGSVFITTNAGSPVVGGGIAAHVGSGIGGLINTAASGNVTIVTNDLVDYKAGTGGIVAGSSAIEAGTAGTGHVSVTVNGPVNSVVDGVFGATGVVVQPSSPGNFVQVTTGSGGVINAARIGILVEASGPAIVNVNASVTGAGGVGAVFTGFHDGIRVLSADQVTITTAAGIQVKGGDIGIFADQTSGSGATLINNSATVIGAGTATHPVISLATNNAATLNNMGFIFSAAGLPGDVAIGEKGGTFTLNNSGLVIGQLQVSTATINNSSAWATFGTNTFGTGNNTINNSGMIVVAGTAGNTGSATDFTATGSLNVTNTGLLAVSGSAAFSGLGGTSFANAGGLIDMRQGVAGDAVTMNGNFSGGAGSRLAVDTFLGGAGSKSDQLFVSGNVTSNTSIIVRDVNTGPGGFTGPGGIPIVTVSGSSAPSNFTLDPASTVIGGAYSPLNGGELRKGLFDYVLVDDPGHFNLVSIPNAMLFQMPVALTAAQTIWYETALGWEDRHMDMRDLQFSAAAFPSLKDPQEAPIAAYPGMWVKASGTWVNRSDNAGFSIGGQSFPFDLGYRQNILGLTGGIDFIDKGVTAARDLIGISMMGGYLASDLDFNKTPASFNFSGGTVALSASYLNSGFFADALVKTDLLNLKTGGLPFAPAGGATTDATTWGVMGTAGYRFTYGSAFAEPMATLAYTHTAIGNLGLPAAGINVLFDDEATLRGAIGARFGAWIADTQAYGIKATLIARFWDQFEGNNHVTIANAGLPLELSDKFTGAFGEAALNLEYSSREAGVAAFLAGGIKANEDFTAATAKAGIRYRF